MTHRAAAILLVAALGVAVATAARADWPRPAPPTEPGRAVLVVVSRPWSNVKVDGRRVGPTPVRLELAPGRHRLELRTGDGRVFRDRIMLRAGQSLRVMHRFDR